jgi:hypothetical protein
VSCPGNNMALVAIKTGRRQCFPSQTGRWRVRIWTVTQSTPRLLDGRLHIFSATLLVAPRWLLLRLARSSWINSGTLVGIGSPPRTVFENSQLTGDSKPCYFRDRTLFDA